MWFFGKYSAFNLQGFFVDTHHMTNKDLSIASLSLANHNSEERKLFIKNNTKCPITIAKEFVKSSEKIVKSNNSLYIYKKEDGVYALFDKLLFESYFLAFIEEFDILDIWNRNRLKLIYKYLKVAPLEEVELDKHSNHLCLKNGVLNIDTNELKEHSDKYYFTCFIKINFKRNEQNAPNFLNFLKDITNNDKELIDFLLNLGGYLLSPENKANKFFLFNGQGASGKSTLLNIYSMFFPDKFITAISLADLSQNTFNRTDILHSRLNVATEEARSILEAKEIKKIISGENLQVLRKFEQPITFKPNTKLILASNGLPRFNDTSEGIYRRMIIINLPNQYLDKIEYDRKTNPEKQNMFIKNRQLFERDIKPEASVILNIFIERYKTLKKNGFNFVEPNSSIKSKRLYRGENDSVREFLLEHFELDNNKEISAQEVLGGFRIWADENGLPCKIGTPQLGRRIREVFSIPEGIKRSSLASGKQVLYPLKKLQPLTSVVMKNIW